MSVVQGNGSFHRLGLGSLNHCTVAFAQIHCAFTSVLFARFRSNALRLPFLPTPVAIRQDRMRYLLSGLTLEGLQHSTNAKGAISWLLPAQFPSGLPERAQLCHAVLNRVRASAGFHYCPGDLVFSHGPVAIIASATRASSFAGHSRTRLRPRRR